MQKLSSLITLGTASPSPRRGRAQSSNLLTVNGTHYIVDAGDGVTRRIAQAGIDVREIGIIFITHHHDDHTAGLGTLMSVAWGIRQRTKPIHVYGPPRTEELVKYSQYPVRLAAEDILEEIFIQSWNNIEHFDEYTFSFDVFLYQNANLVLDKIFRPYSVQVTADSECALLGHLEKRPPKPL